jgi:hypothetical protein
LANPKLPAWQGSDQQRECRRCLGHNSACLISSSLISLPGRVDGTLSGSRDPTAGHRYTFNLTESLGKADAHCCFSSDAVPIGSSWCWSDYRGRLTGGSGPSAAISSADHFASYCGAAPVERGSGQNSRIQVNPGGKRRLNWALHMVALVLVRVEDRSKEFVATQVTEGKSKRAALRLLKTYIAREIFKVMSRSCALSDSFLLTAIYQVQLEQ